MPKFIGIGMVTHVREANVNYYQRSSVCFEWRDGNANDVEIADYH